MPNRIPQSVQYGDHGFRERFRGLPSEEVRRRIDDFAAESISRSIAAGVSVRNAMFDWPWLRAAKR